MLTKPAQHAAVLVLLLAAFLLLIVRRVAYEPYVYDEADYMYAASLGVSANFEDVPTLSLSDYLRAGMASKSDANARQHLSERIRESNDVTLYRHWHGPAFYYLLIPMARAGLDERGVRMTMLAIPVITLVVMYLGCLWLLPGPRGFLAAVLASTLFLSSYALTRSTELAPHQLFVLCSLCMLILLIKAVNSPRKIYWYGAVFAAAIGFCTLELALVSLIVLAVCAYVERKHLQPYSRFLARSLALFGFTVMAIWPAAILKLSFLKAYMILGYLALSRQSPWGNVGFLDTWRTRFAASPAEWCIILLALMAYFRPPLSAQRMLYPILLYAVLMIAAMLRVLSDTPRYSLLFMPELDLFAGLTLAFSIERLPKTARVTVLATLILVIYSAAQYLSFVHPGTPNARSAALLSLVHRSHLEEKALLVPQDEVPMLHLYFPAAKLRGFTTPRPLPSDRFQFAADAIIYQSYPVGWEILPPH